MGPCPSDLDKSRPQPRKGLSHSDLALAQAPRAPGGTPEFLVQEFLLCFAWFCPDQSRQALSTDSSQQQCLPYQQVNSSTQLSNPWRRALASEPVNNKLGRETQKDLTSVTCRKLKNLEKTIPQDPFPGWRARPEPSSRENPGHRFCFSSITLPQHPREGSRLILVSASAADLNFWRGGDGARL